MVAFVRRARDVRVAEAAPKWGITSPDVVAAARSGCRNSIEHLYETIGERVRRTARSILQDEHAAEDTVQDTFVAVLEQLPDLRDSIAFETWVLRIARNIAINARRRRTRCSPSQLVHEDGGHPGSTVIGQWTSREPAPLAVVIVRAAVDEMSGAVRETMELRYGAGMSCAAIARRQGISLSSVKTRLYRGRTAMREASRAIAR